MTKAKKVSIIGIGGVGTHAACFAAGIAEHVVIYNRQRSQNDERVDGLCRDLYDAVFESADCRITGTTSYKDLSESDFVAITIGLGREFPYETRDMLFFRNASLLKASLDNVYKVSPHSRIIISTNPVDYMGKIAKKAGFDEANIFCLGGELDKARLVRLTCDALEKKISRHVSPKEINNIYVLGSHGPQMVSVLSGGEFQGQPLKSILSAEEMEHIAQQTCSEGATMTKKKGKSAVIGPGAQIAWMIHKFMKGEELLAHTYVQSGELKPLGIGSTPCDTLFLGLPFKITTKGKEIIPINMSADELAAMQRFVDGQKNRDTEVESILTKTQEGLPEKEKTGNFITFMEQKGVIIQPVPGKSDDYQLYSKGEDPKMAVGIDIRKYIG